MLTGNEADKDEVKPSRYPASLDTQFCNSTSILRYLASCWVLAMEKRNEGLRLRSDSTGSLRSAFHHGTINNAHHGDGGHGRELCQPTNMTGCAKNGGYKRSVGKAFSLAGHNENKTPTSTFAIPVGNHQRGSNVVGRSLLPPDEPSCVPSERTNEQPWTPASNLESTWLRAGSGSRYSFGADAFIEEAPLMEETELKGMFLDFDKSPSASPTNPSLFIDGHDCEFLHAWVPSSPTPSSSNRGGQIHDPRHKSYGTSFPNEALGSLDLNAVFANGTVYNIGKRAHLFVERIRNQLDFSGWLSVDANGYREGEGEEKTLIYFLRICLYNPINPEFTSLQQFVWAVLLGLLMGILTAIWKAVIEFCVELVWKMIPEKLLDLGLFTDIDGSFPLYHYMWITPAIFGGLLSYITSSVPNKIPGQNEWIHDLHSRGVHDSNTFWLVVVLSTAGMASGLSLGPELPLILTSGMIGSWLGVACNQSILSARVLNLTAASAAIGGFFGFPLAGALFVLEVPHRMGLQYFEAITPTTISSIVAVLTNRLVAGNDIAGYYKYPFLNETLPSSIFHDAIAHGCFGAAIGIGYAKAVLFLKSFVHEIFNFEENTQEEEPMLGKNDTNDTRTTDESSYLIQCEDEPPAVDESFTVFPKHTQEKASFRLTIPHEATRAAVVGCIVGIIVGVTCMFLPHVMFWGESQLQSMIDQGKTPLPIFGDVDEPSGGLVALGFCMLDRSSIEGDNGFSLGCSAAIALAKIFVTGLSLGTGIVGGHFWAPLFVGCAASHFLTDVMTALSEKLGVSWSLASYPCVALLCIMGSVHVVTFRAHVAIILILTLTIDAFDPQDGDEGSFRVAGDYSAVFPLLAVAVFIALQMSRQTIFYHKQRSRGDIVALPEVLCQPGKEGRPLAIDYDENLLELEEEESLYGYHSDDSSDGIIGLQHEDGIETQLEIEAEFISKMQLFSVGRDKAAHSPLPPRPVDRKTAKSPLGSQKSRDSLVMHTNASKKDVNPFPSAQLDQLLMGPIREAPSDQLKRHRRTRSEPFHDSRNSSTLFRANAGVPQRSEEESLKKPASLIRVSSFGQVDVGQPSLLDQARERAASHAESSVRRIPRAPPPASVSPRVRSRKNMLRS